MSETFALGDVLSVTTGALVSRDHMAGIYRVLNFMTGDDLFTHQLPRAMREVEPSLREQHPGLFIDPPDLEGVADDDTKAAVFDWLAEQEARFGETVEVRPLPPGDHTRIDPLSELGLMGVPSERIIVAGGEA